MHIVNITDNTCTEKTNKVLNYIFVIFLLLFVIFFNKLDFTWILISIFILIALLVLMVMNESIDEFVSTMKIPDCADKNIESVNIKNGVIQFNMIDKSNIKHSYQDIKEINIDVNVGTGQVRTVRAPGTWTIIRNTTLQFLFNDKSTKTINMYYSSRITSLNKIKWILKEFKNYNINTSYQGSGDIADIKDQLEFYKKHHESKLLSESTAKDCLMLSAMFAIAGPIISCIFVMPFMAEEDLLMPLFSICGLFLIIALLIASPVIIDKIRCR